MQWYETDGPILALGVVAVFFICAAALELALPHRRWKRPRLKRWTTNLTLFALDMLLVRLAIPLLMIGTAALAAQRGWGLFNAIDLPDWLAFAGAILLLDLALFLQHWATHRVPLLWRLHKVHHVDPEFDISTAARFHPLEIGLSMLYKMAVVALIGPSVLAVFVFELVFTLGTIVTHANLSLPPHLDRIVRRLMVTPDMHRIHHSTVQGETDSNYGTLFSFWDRLFATYTPEAQAGRGAIQIGLAPYRDTRPSKLWWSLLFPFRD